MMMMMMLTKNLS